VASHPDCRSTHGCIRSPFAARRTVICRDESSSGSAPAASRRPTSRAIEMGGPFVAPADCSQTRFECCRNNTDGLRTVRPVGTLTRTGLIADIWLFGSYCFIAPQHRAYGRHHHHHDAVLPSSSPSGGLLGVRLAAPNDTRRLCGRALNTRDPSEDTETLSLRRAVIRRRQVPSVIIGARKSGRSEGRIGIQIVRSRTVTGSCVLVHARLRHPREALAPLLFHDTESRTSIRVALRGA
jgi:hypothetical protein